MSSIALTILSCPFFSRKSIPQKVDCCTDENAARWYTAATKTARTGLKSTEFTNLLSNLCKIRSSASFSLFCNKVVVL